MKCGCAVSGPCARIELSLCLYLGSIGSMVVVAMARIQVLAIMKAVQVVIPVDTSFVPVVHSLVPVHLERWAVVVVVAVATIKQ